MESRSAHLFSKEKYRIDAIVFVAVLMLVTVEWVLVIGVVVRRVIKMVGMRAVGARVDLPKRTWHWSQPALNLPVLPSTIQIPSCRVQSKLSPPTWI